MLYRFACLCSLVDNDSGYLYSKKKFIDLHYIAGAVLYFCLHSREAAMLDDSTGPPDSSSFVYDVLLSAFLSLSLSRYRFGLGRSRRPPVEDQAAVLKCSTSFKLKWLSTLVAVR